MVDLRVIIGDSESGKCYQKTVPKDETKALFGLQIGETFKGELVGLTGYELKVTGGSDSDGFPMRSDVRGSGKRKALLCGGVGHKQKCHGERRKKTVCSHTVDESTSQLNVRVEKTGRKKLEELFASPKEGDDGSGSSDSNSNKEEEK